MRSIERRYRKIAKKNPIWSSHTCFARAIAGQRFSREAIHFWFNKLVDKDDYAKKEKKQVLAYLETL